jgi:hypothetical protein
MTSLFPVALKTFAVSGSRPARLGLVRTPNYPLGDFQQQDCSDKSPEQFAVRAKACKNQNVITKLTINEKEIWPDVALAKASPIASQIMIAVTGSKHLVVHQQLNNWD